MRQHWPPPCNSWQACSTCEWACNLTVQVITSCAVLCSGLNRNELKAKGFAALAPALQHLTGLTHLQIRMNCLDHAGMAALAPSLQQLTALQYL